MRRIDRVTRLLFILLLAVPLFLSCKKRGNGAGNESSTPSSIAEVQTEENTYYGIVKRVCDGDTYDLLIDGAGREAQRVRMAAIDAPEKGQDYSRRARQFLDSLIGRKRVKLVLTQKDSFGRLLGLTYLEDGTEVSHEMVKAGYAWHYTHYDKEIEFDRLEEEARSAKKGLWADPHPVEPWIEKKLRKRGYSSSEIKQMKIQGLIDDIEAANKIESKKAGQ